MARSVGSIEIVVSANTGRLTAQLTEGGKKAGTAAKREIESELRGLDATIDFKTGQAKQQAKLLAKQIEAQLAGIPLDLDFTEARADLRAFEEQAEALRLVLDTSVELSERDLAEIQADFQAWKERVEADKVAIQLTADSAELLIEADAAARELGARTIQWEIEMRSALAIAEAEAIAAEIEQIEADIKVDADTAAATLKLFGFVEESEAKRIETAVDLDTLAAQIRYDAFLLRNQAQALDLDVDLDLATAEAQLAAFRAQLAGDEFEAAGAKAGDSFARGFEGGAGGGGLSTRMKAIAAGIVVLMEPAAVALEALASGAIQVVSSAFSALASSGGALVPILAGLGASIGSVVIGSVGLVDALDSINEEFGIAATEGREFNMAAEEIQLALYTLGPAATAVAQAFAEIRPQLAAIQEAISEEVFAGIGGQMRILADDVIPDVADALTQAGAVANRFIFELTAAFRDIDFGDTFARISPALDSLGRAIADVLRTVQPFFEAAAPAARELGEMIENAAAALLRLVEAGNQSGAIAAFFDQGLDSLRVWGDLIANVTSALFTLFEAGTAGGNSMLQSLSDIIGRFDDWMNTIAGRNALEDFFETGREALSALVPVLRGLQGFFDNLVSPGAVARFAELAENVGAVLPVLGQLFEVIGRASILTAFTQALAQIGEALQPAIPALQELADALGAGLTDLLRAAQPALDVFGQFFADLARVLTPLIPDLVEVGEALLQALTPQLAANAEAIIDVFVELAPAIKLMLDNAVPLIQILSKLTGAFLAVQTILVKIEAFIIGKVVDAFEFLIDKVRDFLDLLGQVPFLGAFLDYLGLTTDGADEATGSVVHLTEAAEELTPAIQDAADVIADAAAAAEMATTGTDKLEGSYAALRPAIDDAARAVEGDIEVMDKAAVVTEKMRKEQEKLREEAEKLLVAQIELTRGMSGLFSVFSQMEVRGDALRDIFDLGNAPAVAAGAVRDINVALTDLGELFEGDNEKVKDLDKRIGELTAKKNQIPLDVDDKVAGKIAAVEAEMATLTEERATATEKRVAAIDRRMAKLTDKKNQIPLDVDTSKVAGKLSKVDGQIAELVAKKEALGTDAIKVGDIFDIKTGEIRNTVKADEFLDAIDDIRGQVQERLVAAFEGGGAEAAEATAAEWRETLFKSLKKRGFTQAQVDKMFPELKDIKAVLKPAIDRAATENALRSLELISEVIGDTPLTMTVGLALESGALSGEAGQAIDNILALQANPNLDVNILPKVSPEAQQEAANFLRQQGLEIPVGFKYPSADALGDEARAVANGAGPVPVGTIFVPPTQEEVDLATAQVTAMAGTTPFDVTVNPVPPPTLATDIAAIFGDAPVNVPIQPVYDPVTNPLPEIPTIRVPFELDLGRESVGQAAGELGGLLQPSGSFATREVKLSVVADSKGFAASMIPINTALETLADGTTKPTIEIDPTKPVEEIDGIMGKLGQLAEQEAKPGVEIEGLATANTGLDTVIDKADDLDNMEITPSLTVTGLDKANKAMDLLKTNLDAFGQRRVDVPFNFPGVFASGGIVGPDGGIGGEAGTELAIFRNTARLLTSATRLPPGTVVVPMNGRTGSVPTISRQVNNYMTITPQSADPVATAEQIINRAAALAQR